MQLPLAYANAPVKIAMLAGEPSGDKLGEGIIHELKARYPQACFVGIGGKHMIEAGLTSLYPIERLSVMGFIEPLKRAKELLGLRKQLKKLFIANPPDVFIGIDAPDFNLNLERALKQQGIFTMHYVSPTIWAWRPGRIKIIKQAVEHMLLIFPFEKQLYDRHQVPATFVGHTLACQYPIKPDVARCRKELGLSPDKPVAAFMVGSRYSEIVRHSPLFLQTAAKLAQAGVECVFAFHNQSCLEQFQALCHKPVKTVVGRTSEVLQAADVAMVKSGTSTLEATLSKTPHIVVYKTTWLSYQIAKRLVKTPFISMTNILAGKSLVKEFIQDDCNANVCAQSLLALLEPKAAEALKETFLAIHHSLLKQTDKVASNVIEGIIGRRQETHDCRG